MAGYNPLIKILSSKLEKGNDSITVKHCILFQACEQKEAQAGGQSKEEVITMVMQVFVDAYTHIPEHRRLMLFSRLVEIVGGDNFLWRCVLLKMAHEITRPTSEPTEVSNQIWHIQHFTVPVHQFILTEDYLSLLWQEDDAEMQFDLNLLSQFSVTTQINSIAAMITYVSGLPVDKPTGKWHQFIAVFMYGVCISYTLYI